MQPDAAGLVIAADQDHARGIARLLHQRHRATAVVATSDDPAASTRIARFAEGRDPWIVAVRMVSEGVDIPRLRLGVFATTTTTELVFRQAVGRFVRHTGGKAAGERAWLFIPDDPRLRTWAATIAEARRHSLVRNHRVEDVDEPIDPLADAAFDELPVDPDEQLSLFSVLSAQVVASSEVTASVFDDGLDDDEEAEVDDGGVAVDLPPPPPPGAGRFSMALPEDLGGRPLSEVKKELREANADLAMHGRLNRMAGIERITDATLDQLRRRADQAERWIASL